MSGIHETKGTSNSSVLKTTTWGALMAFSATIMVAGLVGYNPWSNSGNLAGPTATIADRELPASAKATPTAKDRSWFGHPSTRAVPLHGKTLPAQTGVAQASVSKTATAEKPVRLNQNDLSHSSAPSSDISAASASASPDDDQPVVALSSSSRMTRRT
jgi:hypothetical protein